MVILISAEVLVVPVGAIMCSGVASRCVFSKMRFLSCLAGYACLPRLLLSNTFPIGNTQP
eukprot:5563108-Pyramimonas_sp.AAC.1